MAPASVEEAVALLAANPEARALSGGATLVAMKNAGLIDVSGFVSLARIPGLRGISQTDDGGLRIGAMTRHNDIAASDKLRDGHAMLRQAAGMIANRVVRNMGTIGGAVANADPAADYLPVLACADARIEIAGPAERQEVPMTDYITGWYESVLQPGEVVTAILLPAAEKWRSLYRKVARTPGDYATASCAMAVAGDQVRVAIGACGPGPIRSIEAEARLSGRLADEAGVNAFCETLAGLADPVDDVRGTAGYRLRLMPRLIRAALWDLVEGKAS